MAEGFHLQCSQCGALTPATGAPGEKPRCACGMPLIPSNCLPVELTDETFASEAAGPGLPTVTVLWSPFCATCDSYLLSVRKMAADFFPRVRVFTLNVEENPKTGAELDIHAVPAVLLYRDGELLRAMGGPQGARGILKALGLE